MQARDAAGNIESSTATRVQTDVNYVGVREGNPLPQSIAMLQAFPNPTGDAARIGLHVLRDGRTRVEVVNMLGQVVAVLHDGLLHSGDHAWMLDAACLPAGAYHVVVTNNGTALGMTVNIVR